MCRTDGDTVLFLQQGLSLRPLPGEGGVRSTSQVFSICRQCSLPRMGSALSSWVFHGPLCVRYCRALGRWTPDVNCGFRSPSPHSYEVCIYVYTVCSSIGLNASFSGGGSRAVVYCSKIEAPQPPPPLSATAAAVATPFDMRFFLIYSACLYFFLYMKNTTYIYTSYIFFYIFAATYLPNPP